MSHKPTKGAFGGSYNHEVIRQLRAEAAKQGLIAAALVEHTKISQQELNRVVSEYITRKESEIVAGKV